MHCQSWTEHSEGREPRTCESRGRTAGPMLVAGQHDNGLLPCGKYPKRCSVSDPTPLSMMFARSRWLLVRLGIATFARLVHWAAGPRTWAPKNISFRANRSHTVLGSAPHRDCPAGQHDRSSRSYGMRPPGRRCCRRFQRHGRMSDRRRGVRVQRGIA